MRLGSGSGGGVRVTVCCEPAVLGELEMPQPRTVMLKVAECTFGYREALDLRFLRLTEPL